MSAVDVHVSHGGGDPFVAEELLDGDDVHTVAVKRRRAVVPQHVRAEPAPPGRQVPGHRPGKADAQCPGADPAGVALGGLALGAQQRGARLVPAVVEAAALFPPGRAAPPRRALRADHQSQLHRADERADRACW